ncbi:uncharacterized protein LOC133316037 [Gastrolobium bilobum]|uniref:uncharacterized protein LOC133316037 n=1 Tax=Gastrolobium bilobum TaxID=150636 RepID=UPI002AAF9C80|nr:uncharacterized protein LOC133316037 [Gastrolobium bilobum]
MQWEEDWMTIQRKEEEEDDILEEVCPEKQVNPLCPVHYFSKKQHKEDCRRWRKALIIKLMGRKIRNRFLMTRLKNQWRLGGGIEVADLDNDYILINFKEEKDYQNVLHGGPWIVVDHYVVVQRWRPMFDPYEEEVTRIVVWVCIPGLPMKFYTTHHLWRIGNLLGKTLKVHKNLLRKSNGREGEYTEKAKYARICIEVDMRKSFVSQFQLGELGDKILYVAYEGLHLICFRCGRYGHRQDICSGGIYTEKTPDMVQAGIQV